MVREIDALPRAHGQAGYEVAAGHRQAAGFRPALALQTWNTSQPAVPPRFAVPIEVPGGVADRCDSARHRYVDEASRSPVFAAQPPWAGTWRRPRASASTSGSSIARLTSIGRRRRRSATRNCNSGCCAEDQHPDEIAGSGVRCGHVRRRIEASPTSGPGRHCDTHTAGCCHELQQAMCTCWFAGIRASGGPSSPRNIERNRRREIHCGPNDVISGDAVSAAFALAIDWCGWSPSERPCGPRSFVHRTSAARPRRPPHSSDDRRAPRSTVRGADCARAEGDACTTNRARRRSRIHDQPDDRESVPSSSRVRATGDGLKVQISCRPKRAIKWTPIQ